MRGSSQAALDQADQVLRDALEGPQPDSMRVAEDFFGLADLARTDSRLRRALTDPGRSTEDKQELVEQVFGAGVQPTTVAVIKTLVAGHWSDTDDIRSAFEVLGIHAVLDAAKRAGHLADVEAELFEVAELLRSNAELRYMLSDLGPGHPHDRSEMARQLFERQLSPWTMRLVRRGVKGTTHGRLLATLRRFATHAATLEGRQLVEVEVAQPLSAPQTARLRSIVEKRVGSEVTMNVSINPSLLGGFKLRTGDISVDTSVSAEVSTLKQALVR